MIMHILKGDEQYRLHAYVCGNACVKNVDNMGTVSFTHVFTNRPYDCRYAVVSQWNVAKHATDVLVWDLYETTEKLSSGKLVPPQPVNVFDDVDAAIMATSMTYKDD